MKSIKHGKTIKPGNKLSDIDIQEIKLLYKCPNTAKLTTKNSEVGVKNNIKKGLIFYIK